MSERERLIARVRSLRRVAASAAAPRTTRDGEPESGDDTSDPARIADLERRVAHLERLIEGLQDSVHRENQRQDRRLADLEAQIQPDALTAAINKDARDRGL
ncbi:MAG: hypothetical protein WBQ18_00770 [Solirubrobacteraceae bacterium]